MLPECYPLVTEMIPNSVTVQFTRPARVDQTSITSFGKF